MRHKARLWYICSKANFVCLDGHCHDIPVQISSFCFGSNRELKLEMRGIRNRSQVVIVINQTQLPYFLICLKPKCLRRVSFHLFMPLVSSFAIAYRRKEHVLKEIHSKAFLQHWQAKFQLYANA